MEDIKIRELTYVKDLGFDRWVMIADDEGTVVTYGKERANGVHVSFENALSVAKKAKKFSGNQIGLFQYKTRWNEQNELVGDLVQVGVV